MVDVGAVLQMALQGHPSPPLRPHRPGCIDGGECRVHGKAVEAIERDSVACPRAFDVHALLAHKPGTPGAQSVLGDTSVQQGRRAVGGGVVEGGAPTPFTGTQIRVTQVQVRGASGPHRTACKPAIQAGQGFVHAKPCRFHRGHGGREIQTLVQQGVGQRGFVGAQGLGRWPGAQLDGVTNLHLSLAHKRDIHFKAVCLGHHALGGQAKGTACHQARKEPVGVDADHSSLVSGVLSGVVSAASKASMSKSRSDTASCTSGALTLARMDSAVALAWKRSFMPM